MCMFRLPYTANVMKGSGMWGHPYGHHGICTHILEYAQNIKTCFAATPRKNEPRVETRQVLSKVVAASIPGFKVKTLRNLKPSMEILPTCRSVGQGNSQHGGPGGMVGIVRGFTGTLFRMLAR